MRATVREIAFLSLVANIDANPISSIKPTLKSEERSTKSSSREERQEVVQRDFIVISVLCASIVVLIVLCILVVVCRKRAAKKRKRRCAELEKDSVEELPRGSASSQRHEHVEVHVEMPAGNPPEDDDPLKSKSKSSSLKKSAKKSATNSVTQSTVLNSDIFNLNHTQSSSRAPTPKVGKKKGGNTAFSTYNPDDYEEVAQEVLRSDRTQTVGNEDNDTAKRTDSLSDAVLESLKVPNYEPNKAPKRVVLPRTTVLKRASREFTKEEPTQPSVRQVEKKSDRSAAKKKAKAKTPARVKSPVPKSQRKAVDKMMKNANWNVAEDGVPIDHTYSAGESLSKSRSQSTTTEEPDGRPYPRVTADDIMAIRAGEQAMADEEDEDDDDLPGVPHKESSTSRTSRGSRHSVNSKETDVEFG